MNLWGATRCRLASVTLRTCGPRQRSVIKLRRSLATKADLPVVSSTAQGDLKFSHYEQSSDARRFVLPKIWLRDNCRCATCINQDTMQRNFNTFDIPEDLEPSRIEPSSSGLKITWSKDLHESFYPWDFLDTYMRADKPEAEPLEPEYFGARGHENVSVKCSELLADNSSNAIGRLTDLIRRKGYAFITEVPYESADSTQELLEKIAFIRQTHYGGFYDFIPDLAHADTAYTNIALSAHTDTTYFTEPAGLQAFHLLSHVDPTADKHTATKLGGQSLLVDGFHAAYVLFLEDPVAFGVLSDIKLPWHASGNPGITIAPDRLYPVLEVDEDTGKMHRVRWNNDDRGVVPFGGNYDPDIWYKAARKWNDILRRQSMEYWFQLKPGNIVVFDNWRVLHGRSAFTGVRRICGGYINRDDFISRWRNTNYPREEILKRVVG